MFKRRWNSQYCHFHLRLNIFESVRTKNKPVKSLRQGYVVINFLLFQICVILISDYVLSHATCDVQMHGREIDSNVKSGPWGMRLLAMGGCMYESIVSCVDVCF